MKVSVQTSSFKDIIVDVPTNTKLAPNFTLKELANNLAKEDVKYIITERTILFNTMIQELRHEIGVINVSSCYRTKSFNASLKGADPRSCHLIGCALDFIRKNETDEQRVKVASIWRSLCQKHGVIGAINYYTDGYHVEIFSDVQYGNKNFVIRDYRRTSKDW